MPLEERALLFFDLASDLPDSQHDARAVAHGRGEIPVGDTGAAVPQANDSFRSGHALSEERRQPIEPPLLCRVVARQATQLADHGASLLRNAAHLITLRNVAGDRI